MRYPRIDAVAEFIRHFPSIMDNDSACSASLILRRGESVFLPAFPETPIPVLPVPESSAITLIGAGFIALAALRLKVFAPMKD